MFNHSLCSGKQTTKYGPNGPFTKTNLPQQDILVLLALIGIFSWQFKKKMIV